ncbi:hypothetical protein LTR56_003508 [Elasticomyces elasticus]|nr:hypothetical protein LTR56_003508 [Elasticomyces elasticus]KAK4917477.1 hypothetical protein LTR49_014697 [Elasticomyces elasticus]KAK5752558.1 hypothetical protein LTS12_017400 [Elasticomyces elasticus]
MARLRSAPAAPAPEPKAHSQRPALKEKTNTTRAKAAGGDDEQGLGDMIGLVKESTKRRGRPRKSAHADDEVVMAGGLGVKETDAPVSTDELGKSDAIAPPTAKANRRPPRMTRKPIHNEAQSKVLDGLRKRMEETARKEGGKKGAVPALRRVSSGPAPSSDVLPSAPVIVRTSAAVAQERSEYSISPSPPPPNKLASVQAKRSSLAQQSSSPKPRSTPAMDTSVLKNFKRRARQPTYAKPIDDDPSIYDFDGGDAEEEDDFAPDAEGTPLNASKAKRKSMGSSIKKSAAKPTKVKPAPVTKKRKSEVVDVSAGSLETLRAKRRKPEVADSMINDLEEPLGAPEVVPPTRRSSTESARQATPVPQETSDIQVINSSQSSPPPAESTSPEKRQASVDDDFVVPSTEEYREEDIPHEPDLDLPEDPLYDVPDGTMAEPASSSPLPDVLIDTQMRLRDELADPVTQVSPPPVKAKPVKASKVKPVSTATLQNLLPKRRQPLRPRHRKSEYDFVSESEGEADGAMDDDDTEEAVGRGWRRQTKITPGKGRRKTAATTKTAKAKKIVQQSTRKSTAPPTTSKPTKTYGRAAAALLTSDKENDDGFEEIDGDVDDSAEILLPDRGTAEATAKSNELEAAKRKFAEVDEWDMEFESVGAEEHRSSSQQWR